MVSLDERSKVVNYYGTAVCWKHSGQWNNAAIFWLSFCLVDLQVIVLQFYVLTVKANCGIFNK